MAGFDVNATFFLGMNLIQLISIPLTIFMFAVATWFGVKYNGDRPEFVLERDRVAHEAAEIAKAKFAELGLSNVIPEELLPEFARSRPPPKSG